MREVIRACWRNMKYRCLNPEHKSYPDYGGRGITVCQEWIDDFEVFYRDMGPKPTSLHSIERIDNDGPYCAANCCWATRKEQTANRRVTYVFQGIPQTLESLAAWFLCSQATVDNYIKRHNGDMEAAWASLAVLRDLVLEMRRNDLDAGASERVREVGEGAPKGSATSQSPSPVQEMRGDVRLSGDADPQQNLPKKTRRPARTPRTGRKGETERVRQNRIRAIQWKLEGLTYQKIGELLGVTNQRAVQLVQPSASVKDVVFCRAKGRCERCGSMAVCSFHHLTTTGKTEETFNLPENLEYLCGECHLLHHNKVDPLAAIRRGLRGGRSRSKRKIESARANMFKALDALAEQREEAQCE